MLSPHSHAPDLEATVAFVLVFIAGLSMAPCSHTLAIVGNVFPRMSGTASLCHHLGWARTRCQFPPDGAIAGGDPLRLKKALLLIPASAVLM